MSNRLRVMMMLGMFIAILLGAINCQKEESIIKIGAIVPLTGDSAQWGIPPRNGAELAVSEINSKGGIDSKHLKLFVEDTTCNPKEGVSAFNKLTASGDLKIVIGGVCSSVTLAVAPIAERNRILLISPASTNPKITDAGDFIFRVIPSDHLRGKKFAEYVYSDKKILRVAIVYINNEGGVGNKDSFKSRFIQLGGEVVMEEAYAQNSTDIRSQITKANTPEVEAVVVVSYPKDTILVMKQSQELGLSKPLYFQTEAVEDPNVLREAGEAAEGVTYILPAPAAGEVPSKFASLYKEKYGKEPELFAAEAYDIVQLIAEAIRTNPGKELTADLIGNYLYSVKSYQGASGEISFDENGDVIKPMAIKQIVDGKPVTILIR